MGVAALWAGFPASAQEALSRLSRAARSGDWNHWRQTLAALLALAERLGAAKLAALARAALSGAVEAQGHGAAQRAIDSLRAVVTATVVASRAVVTATVAAVVPPKAP
jgi:cobalamin biosynthesis Mg chelatase CobN